MRRLLISTYGSQCGRALGDPPGRIIFHCSSFLQCLEILSPSSTFASRDFILWSLSVLLHVCFHMYPLLLLSIAASPLDPLPVVPRAAPPIVHLLSVLLAFCHRPFYSLSSVAFCRCTATYAQFCALPAFLVADDPRFAISRKEKQHSTTCASFTKEKS